MLRRYIFLSSLFLAGCAGHGDSAGKDAILRSSLPASWYQAPELAAQVPEEPGYRADQVVRTTFRTYAEALPTAPVPTNLLTMASLQSPWHLDGMIANFGIGVGGVFGALLADGSAAVKVIWRKSFGAETVGAPAKKREAIRFRSSMTAADVSRLLEPAVQTAASAGSVRDTAALRQNLHTRGMRFLNIVRALEKIPAVPGWRVDSFELELWIGAQGQVTPTLGIGAQLGVVFNWAMPDDVVATQKPTGPLADFTRSLAAILPDRASRAELSAAGFDLAELQIGVVAAAGGTIGIAAASAEATGKLIFTPSNVNSAPHEALVLDEIVPIVASTLTPEQASYLDRVGVSLDRGAEASAVVTRVPGDRLRNGLAHALHMGSYFARHARESESARWKVASIEAEFTASVGGDLRVATVEAGGQVTLVFNRKGAAL